MARKFAEITFTPSVKAAQSKYGSRQSNMGFEMMDTGPDLISPIEKQFIEAQHGFYQATVNANGWPYVQFRGGPAGFLKVIDERTIGYADFRGNVQYLSVGNLADNDRVSIILMDYPNRRRLKIWARARLVDYSEDPELVESLEIPTYRARVERGVILKIEAMDWNCPQHITPKFTEQEVMQIMEPVYERLKTYEEALKEQQQNAAVKYPEILGNGPLALEITGIRKLTDKVKAFELRHVNGEELPDIEAGAHIDIPVQLEDGKLVLNSYSIASHSEILDCYEIAVALEEDGNGGSKAIHEYFQIGTKINASYPRNAFELADENNTAVLIAGGIGITPIKAMAHELAARKQKCDLHYAGKSLKDMPYRDELRRLLYSDLNLYSSVDNNRMDISKIIRESAKDSHFYVCGPKRMVDAVIQAAAENGISSDRVHFELFNAADMEGARHSFQLHLKKSDKVIEVAQGETILKAMLDNGLEPAFGCGTGTCRTCAVQVLEGEVEHRDSALAEEERDGSKLMCLCVSTAKSKKLVIDA